MAEYELLRQVTPQAAVVLQNNPGPMTLSGTNTWVLRDPASTGSVVVDPGEASDAHLSAILAAAGPVELIVLTHHHHDHAQLAPALQSRTGAAVRAVDVGLCVDGAPLRDGEVIAAGGVELRVLATPGHTADSACLLLGADAVLTGDTILGRGTTVVVHPDGHLGAYVDSLRRLESLGDLTVLPGHGPELPSVAAVAAAYLAHRAARLDEVRAALVLLGPDASARAIVEHVYADVDPSVWWAAELSVQAQLEYLRSAG